MPDPIRAEAAAATPDGRVVVSVPITITIGLPGPGAAPAVAVSAPAVTAAPGVDPDTGEAVSIDPNYDTRAGYDPAFLGTGASEVPLPVLPAALRTDAATVRGADADDDPHELKYHHFSVVLNRRRRLAFFTAVNIDGRSHRRAELPREKDKWFFDPRVPKAEQVGEELYAANPFDRGHLVRRLDPAWGRSVAVAKTANDDTFHFANCSPQHEDFNQGKQLWAGLEDFLLDKAGAEGKRVTVFTGPVFCPEDQEYRGVKIPAEFWKVACYVKRGAGLVAAGFVVSQAELIRPVVLTESTAAERAAKTFQVRVAEVARLSKLDFGALVKADVLARRGVSFDPTAEEPRVPLDDASQILLC